MHFLCCDSKLRPLLQIEVLCLFLFHSLPSSAHSYLCPFFSSCCYVRMSWILFQKLPTVIVVRILAGEDVDVSLAGGHEGGPSHAGQDCEEC